VLWVDCLAERSEHPQLLFELVQLSTTHRFNMRINFLLTLATAGVATAAVAARAGSPTVNKVSSTVLSAASESASGGCLPASCVSFGVSCA
jgi:hypothetical protein